MTRDWKNNLAKTLAIVTTVEALGLITNSSYYETTAQDLRRRADIIDSREKRQDLLNLAQEFQMIGDSHSKYPNPRLLIPLEFIFSGNYSKGCDAMGYEPGPLVNYR